MNSYNKDTVSVKIIQVKGQVHFLNWNTWWIVCLGHSLVSSTLHFPAIDLHFILPTLRSSNKESNIAHYYQILYLVSFPL